MDTTPAYTPPLSLTILSALFIGIFALVALWIGLDIIYRQGWKSMMAVMIPVYILNALYLAPLTLWTYLNYGRPPKPSKDGGSSQSHRLCHIQGGNGGMAPEHRDPEEKTEVESDGDNTVTVHSNANSEMRPHDHPSEKEGRGGTVLRNNHHVRGDGSQDDGPVDIQIKGDDTHRGHDMSGHEHHHMNADRPMFATVTVGVCHCGAGCLLGDIVGEWLVYSTGVQIRGRMLWPEFLIDYAFALVFGIVFQYFSIAPMSGDYGMKTTYRAIKADILSLTSFEIGLFGWMAIFQIAIFNWRIEMNTITYWWMMQIGMFLGHWTAMPVNWWLIQEKIKEPCA